MIDVSAGGGERDLAVKPTLPLPHRLVGETFVCMKLEYKL